MNKTLLGLSIVLVLTGCAPKMGKIHTMMEPESNNTAEIFIIRNYNYIGSAIRLYPTVNDRKIAGLYTQNYIHFYLKEGSYTFSVKHTDVLLGRWIQGNIIKKIIDANKQYYFLLSPNIIMGMEIEEINDKNAEERLESSIHIQTGNLSHKPDKIVKVIQPLSDAMGLDEDDGRK